MFYKSKTTHSKERNGTLCLIVCLESQSAIIYFLRAIASIRAAELPWTLPLLPINLCSHQSLHTNTTSCPEPSDTVRLLLCFANSFQSIYFHFCCALEFYLRLRELKLNLRTYLCLLKLWTWEHTCAYLNNILKDQCETYNNQTKFRVLLRYRSSKKILYIGNDFFQTQICTTK